MQNKMLKKRCAASKNRIFINTKKRQGANEPPSETYQAAHSRPLYPMPEDHRKRCAPSSPGMAYIFTRDRADHRRVSARSPKHM